MTEQDPEEFHTCGCRVRSTDSQCLVHDPVIDEHNDPEALLPIPDSMVPGWVDRMEELENL